MRGICSQELYVSVAQRGVVFRVVLVAVWVIGLTDSGYLYLSKAGVGFVDRRVPVVSTHG